MKLIRIASDDTIGFNFLAVDGIRPVELLRISLKRVKMRCPIKSASIVVRGLDEVRREVTMVGGRVVGSKIFNPFLAVD